LYPPAHSYGQTLPAAATSKQAAALGRFPALLAVSNLTAAVSAR